MAIHVDFSDLHNAVKAMGAKLVDFELCIDHGELERIDVDLEHGIEVDITDVDLKNGILSYKGRQVLLYIQDHGGNVQKALDDGSTVDLKGDEEIEYDGEVHTAANLFDALKEGYYGKF